MMKSLQRVISLAAGVVRIALRTVYARLYVAWLRLRVAVWGSTAFEHAMFHCPAWLTIEILKAHGVSIGAEFDFHGRLLLHGTYDMHDKLHIGNRCHIGPGVTLDLSCKVVLEDNCTVSLNSQIITHQDMGYSPLSKVAYPTEWAGVVIEEGAYIGAGTIILMGVRVGRCAVVAAGAVVHKDVPPYTVVAGVPARVIKQLDPTQLGLS